jgi:hypothetical protein
MRKCFHKNPITMIMIGTSRRQPFLSVLLLLCLSITTIHAAADDCNDIHPKCVSFAKEGACESNPEFMLENCKLSCGQCNDIEDEDDDELEEDDDEDFEDQEDDFEEDEDDAEIEDDDEDDDDDLEEEAIREEREEEKLEALEEEELDEEMEEEYDQEEDDEHDEDGYDVDDEAIEVEENDEGEEEEEDDEVEDDPVVDEYEPAADVEEADDEATYTAASSIMPEDEEDQDILPPCIDVNQDCAALMAADKTTNICHQSAHMLRTCRKSCKVCHYTTEYVDQLVARAELGVPQLRGPNQSGAIRDTMELAEQVYDELLTSEHQDDDKDDVVSCQNRDPNCAYWASKGYCEVTAYMKQNCRPTCLRC